MSKLALSLFPILYLIALTLPEGGLADQASYHTNTKQLHDIGEPTEKLKQLTIQSVQRLSEFKKESEENSLKRKQKFEELEQAILRRKHSERLKQQEYDQFKLQQAEQFKELQAEVKELKQRLVESENLKNNSVSKENLNLDKLKQEQSDKLNVTRERLKDTNDEESKCVSTNGYTWIPSESKCFPIRHFIGADQFCHHNEQCTTGLGNLSFCRHHSTNDPSLSYCDCNPNAKYLTSTKKCHLVVYLGERCYEAEQCVAGVNEFASCIRSKCQCSEPSEEWRDSCFLYKTLGDSCKSDLECKFSIRGKTFCDPLHKICSCEVGQVAFDMTTCQKPGTSYLTFVKNVAMKVMGTIIMKAWNYVI